jgi:hypothetical protein
VLLPFVRLKRLSIRLLHQGILTEGEGSIPLTSLY